MINTNVFEAEELYNCEDYIDCDVITLERDDDHAIYLDQPAYMIPEYNLECYSGYYCYIENDEDCVDFSLTAIFKDGMFEYWESDGLAVTLHNYFHMTTGEYVDVNSLECNIHVKTQKSYADDFIDRHPNVRKDFTDLICVYDVYYGGVRPKCGSCEKCWNLLMQGGD